MLCNTHQISIHCLHLFFSCLFSVIGRVMHCLQSLQLSLVALLDRILLSLTSGLARSSVLLFKVNAHKADWDGQRKKHPWAVSLNNS